MLVAIYSVGAHTDGRPPDLDDRWHRAPPARRLLVVGVVERRGHASSTPSPRCACFTAAFVLGDNLRRRRLHVESLADRAERAERERELLARERVAEERTRIARELHDIVAHSVSVMVIQAAAARRNVTTRPEAAEDLLENIERTGRQTMDELRQVLGVLRNADGRAVWRCRVPTLADLPALVDAAAGLPGAPRRDRRRRPRARRRRRVGVPHRAGGADERQPPRRARRQRRRARDVRGDRRRRPRRGRRPRRVGRRSTARATA